MVGDLDEHGVVHEGERLERGVGAVAFCEAGFARAGIEGGEHGEGGGTLLVGVDAAAEAILTFAGVPVGAAVGDLGDADGLDGADGGAEHFLAEKAGGGEGGVADHFGFETLAGELWGDARFDFGVLLVGVGGDDETMEFFERPAVFDEGDGEVVEEFGVGGELALHAKVIERGDDAFAEEGGPVTVDDDAGGKGIFGRGEPLGEFESVFWKCFVFRVDGVGESGGDGLFWLGVFAAVVEVGGAGASGGALGHDEGGGAKDGLLEGANFVGVGFEFRGLKEEVLQGSLMDDGFWRGGGRGADTKLAEGGGEVTAEVHRDLVGGVGRDRFGEVEDGDLGLADFVFE